MNITGTDAASSRRPGGDGATGPRPLVIGTRGSPLALAQAGQVRDWLRAACPGVEITLDIVKTTGDTFLDRPLSEIGGKGLFTKEIDEAMLDGRIDLAVHSMKDVPTVLPSGLIIGCLPRREDPRDVLITCDPDVRGPDDLPPRARIGTVSLRRGAILRHSRPDVSVVMFRGNVGTRLSKLAAGEADATFLALAGLRRLGHELGREQAPQAVRAEGASHGPRAIPLPPDVMLPAIGQGAIGVQCRESDGWLREILAGFDDPVTDAAVTAERAFLGRLDGSCRTPIAALAEIQGDELFLRGAIVAPDGSQRLDTTIRGPMADAARLGREAGDEIAARAGAALLAALKA